MATVGLVPSLNWLRQCERHMLRHLPGASSEAVASLAWSWGCFNHTPSKQVGDDAVGICVVRLIGVA